MVYKDDIMLKIILLVKTKNVEKMIILIFVFK